MPGPFPDARAAPHAAHMKSVPMSQGAVGAGSTVSGTSTRPRSAVRRHRQRSAAVSPAWTARKARSTVSWFSPTGAT